MRMETYALTDETDIARVSTVACASKLTRDDELNRNTTMDWQAILVLIAVVGVVAFAATRGGG